MTLSRRCFVLLHRIVRGLASLKLAVPLVVVYAVVLAWGTLVESRHGMAAAHFAIYDTPWFAAINALLGCNILAALLIRFPWKRRHAGFVVTHLGILVLLAGCLVSRQYGVEAQLSVFEGHASSTAVEDRRHFEIRIRADEATEPSETIDVPFVSGPLSWDRYRELSWFPWRLAHRSEGVIYDRDGVQLAVLDYTQAENASARVRLTIDGVSKEFEVPAFEEGEPTEVAGQGRRASIVLRPDEIPLGFQVFLHQFQRKLDPGTGAPSHYASLVDFLDRDDPPHPLAPRVLITLNAPVDFADPTSGRTYRLFQSSFTGPWTPGDRQFDRLVGSDRTRDRVYRSQLSVNDDPGRGLKYLGSLLIVAGIVMVYYLPSSRGQDF